MQLYLFYACVIVYIWSLFHAGAHYAAVPVPCRHMCEVMLREVGHIPGPELEFAEDRESYSLAAGAALGMIALGVRETGGKSWG